MFNCETCNQQIGPKKTQFKYPIFRKVKYLIHTMEGTKQASREEIAKEVKCCETCFYSLKDMKGTNEDNIRALQAAHAFCL